MCTKNIFKDLDSIIPFGLSSDKIEILHFILMLPGLREEYEKFLTSTQIWCCS